MWEWPLILMAPKMKSLRLRASLISLLVTTNEGIASTRRRTARKL